VNDVKEEPTLAGRQSHPLVGARPPRSRAEEAPLESRLADAHGRGAGDARLGPIASRRPRCRSCGRDRRRLPPVTLEPTPRLWPRIRWSRPGRMTTQAARGPRDGGASLRRSPSFRGF